MPDPPLGYATAGVDAAAGGRAVGHAPHGQLQGRTGEVGREDLRGRSQR